jgi:release factor glutamine methyltransferase
VSASGLHGRAAPRGLPAAQDGEEAWSRHEAWRWGIERLRAAGIDAAAAPLEAEVLLRHAAGISREELLARPGSRLRVRASFVYRDLIARRAAAVPVSYLIGRREFFGIELAVDRRVLIPRPETECLVELVVRGLRAHAAPRVVDVGTGSGAIAIAIVRALPRATALATDISETALRLARRNATRSGVASRITWARGPSLRPLARLVGRGGVDAIVSNPPYIPTSEVGNLPREVREHEPVSALDGGPDGIALHREIIAGAASYVARGGMLALEVAGCWDQARTVADLIAATGQFGIPRITRDHAGLQRVVAAIRGDDGHHRH